MVLITFLIKFRLSFFSLAVFDLAPWLIWRIMSPLANNFLMLLLLVIALTRFWQFCSSKTFFPFNCERKLIICYSAIYYSWTSGSGIKTIFLGYFWCAWTLYWLRIRIKTAPLGFNRFWYGLLWSFGFGFFRASRIRTCSFTAACSCIYVSNFGVSIS